MAGTACRTLAARLRHCCNLRLQRHAFFPVLVTLPMSAEAFASAVRHLFIAKHLHPTASVVLPVALPAGQVRADCPLSFHSSACCCWCNLVVYALSRLIKVTTTAWRLCSLRGFVKPAACLARCLCWALCLWSPGLSKCACYAQVLSPMLAAVGRVNPLPLVHILWTYPCTPCAAASTTGPGGCNIAGSTLVTRGPIVRGFWWGRDCRAAAALLSARCTVPSFVPRLVPQLLHVLQGGEGQGLLVVFH